MINIDTIKNSVALIDRSNWGLLKVTGDDRLRFLHNQTTNNIQGLKVGEGCDTIFVNSTGRNIDLVSAYIQENEVLLLVSPEQNKKLYDWMDRYIFPFDKVGIKDITNDYKIFTLIGEKSVELLSSLVDNEFLKSPEFSHKIIKIDDIELIISVGCNLKLTGFNLIISQEKASYIWNKITTKNPLIINNRDYENLRILQGKPTPNKELTEEYNPLESGLWDAISFNKGCYIGQETIARLNTYKGVKQKLWGIKLNNSINPEIDNIITVEGEKVGKITSYLETKSEKFALGYIRTKAGDIGLKVNIAEVEGEVVNLPFIRHEYYQP
ncbi:folate-dependent protein for Fe/S cluster synthesis/repair in oxidative stress [Geminocystis sp. NIES-3708]|uniref:CAF17-like 4Fe-4S cluster assembly/insertion protein YgfZ n=1 Tax=Geminocystis sp. NIES-3708 TaxID=1615909 RepID=UPI0005FC8676|nr:folate-binding protein YgfZ [Geminocystis sp. NIES-3708]BAQ61766.1 folate-dependent protein for Fe/S cluster synthesis/repair in oxidative stress [Geminocystis sp. NIES-3708]